MWKAAAGLWSLALTTLGLWLAAGLAMPNDASGRQEDFATGLLVLLLVLLGVALLVTVVAFGLTIWRWATSISVAPSTQRVTYWPQEKQLATDISYDGPRHAWLRVEWCVRVGKHTEGQRERGRGGGQGPLTLGVHKNFVSLPTIPATVQVDVHVSPEHWWQGRAKSTSYPASLRVVDNRAHNKPISE